MIGSSDHQMHQSPNHPITQSRNRNGGSPEDVATRPAAYRLPPPEQLPEISLTDETCSVPELFDALMLLLEVEPAPPAVLPAPVDVPPAVLEGFDVDAPPAP